MGHKWLCPLVTLGPPARPCSTSLRTSGRNRVGEAVPDLRLQPLSLSLLLCLCSAFDLVNIHLFHDASNLVAWETSPSVYAGIRHKALGYVLDR